jgi:sulfonate transport system substrate-binding protein
MKRTVSFLIALVVSVMSAPYVHADEPAKVVRIASIGTLSEGKVFVTSQSTRVQTEGWLEKQLAQRGVKLQWHPVATALGGPGFNEALASKSVDFASYGDLPSIIARSAGVDIKLIVPYGGATHSYLIVRKGVQANTLADLKGKRIALQRGRPGELPFTRLSREYGLQASDFKIYNLPPEAGKSALVAGSVDAYFGDPGVYQLEDQGHGKVIWSTKQVPAERGSWNTRVDLYARTEFARANPELTKLVAAAYIRAAHWVSQDEHFDEVVKIYSRPGSPEHVIRRDFAGQPVAWRERWSPVFDAELHDYFDESIKISFERKLIRRQFKASELLDPTYAQAALRLLKLEAFWDAPPSKVAHR